MAITQLLIKYQGKYICSKTKHKIDFIQVPQYYLPEDYPNLSIFITLFFHRIINEDYYSTIALNEIEWSEYFEEAFIDDYLKEIGPNTYLYDLDEYINDCSTEEEKNELHQRFKSLPLGFTYFDNYLKSRSEETFSENQPYFYCHSTPTINPNLKNTIKKLQQKRTDKDVLLMYSGGKDSTLAAIRLVQMGFNVYFIHFDNGTMLDIDKPFLTWQNIFSSLDGYQFPFKYTRINIQQQYQDFFKTWEESHGNKLEDGSIDSEIRCLACRSAMYKAAFKIAVQEGFHYIAEGARISQQFFIEQPEMLNEYQKLAQKLDIKLLFPVLEMSNNQEEIQELIANGLSSKTWESKCLLGRKAKEKSKEDEQLILKYFSKYILPKM